MKKIIYCLILISLFISCGQEEDETIEDNRNIIGRAPTVLNCLRWVDRKLFFATADFFDNERNNEFSKLAIKDVIDTLERETKLGEDYFIQETVSESLLPIFQPRGLAWNDYRSFIQVWSDEDFESFASTYFETTPGSQDGLSNLVDPNAITVVNSTFSRKYFMIFRSSCFNAGNQCNNIGAEGIRALVLRQFGLLMRIPPDNCNSRPDDIMCPQASDTQWSSASRERFYALMDNALTAIQNNLNFYGDGESSVSCLKRPWIDQQIRFAPSTSLDENGTFQKSQIKTALNEIACDTLLGCNYFNYCEDCIASSTQPALIREDNEAPNFSYILVWPDSKFNNYVIDTLNSRVPDPNAVSFVNAAKKSNYSILFRGSCFSQGESCNGNSNTGISEDGVKALVARQLGFTTGLLATDCGDYPEDVMCSELPSDEQWSTKNKFIWVNKFNNLLEFIGNNPNFYDQFFDELPNQDE